MAASESEAGSVSGSASTADDSDARDGYISTNEEHDAVAALEVAARFLEAAETDPRDAWKWAVIALQNAVQGFMVLALQSTWPVRVLHRDQRATRIRAVEEFYRATEAGDADAAAAAQAATFEGEDEMAAFLHLYARIKDPNGAMMQVVNSKVYELRPTDDQCMRCLNDVRNEYIHFVPCQRSMLLTRFPAMAETGLHVIAFLLTESNNIGWFSGSHEDDLRARAYPALARANEAVARLAASYAGLPLPAAPWCGSRPEGA